MKKIILLIIILLLPINTLAQNLDIKILNYDPETGNARLQIKNIASTDFHDLKIKIDNIIEKPLLPFIKADSLSAIFLTIPPGEHEITITTKEGAILTEKLYFSPTEEQLREDIKKRISMEKSETQLKKLPTTQQKKFSLKYIYIILALIAILIIYWIYKRFKPSKQNSRLNAYKK